MADRAQFTMFDPQQLEAARPANCRADEWQARVELAACYRVFASRGWAEVIFNRITLRVPGALRYPKKFRRCFGGKFATIFMRPVESFWIPTS